MANEPEITTAELLKSVKIEKNKDPESKAIAAAKAKTMKHLSVLRRHHANQNKLIKTGLVQVRQRLAQHVNDFMETAVLPNGGVGLVRKKGNKFKRRTHVKQFQEGDKESANRRKSVRKLSKGAMLKHYRNQKRMFAGKELRKFIQIHILLGGYNGVLGNFLLLAISGIWLGFFQIHILLIFALGFGKFMIFLLVHIRCALVFQVVFVFLVFLVFGLVIA